MSNISDDIFKGSILGMIFGLPIFVGIGILAVPFVIISCITGVPMQILVQNLLAFVIALLIIGLLSKHQIIENGIVGLIVGLLIYTSLSWHSLVCVLIGVATVGLLFFFSYIKIGFWIKTILFSAAVTFIVFASLYSDSGLLPMQDKIWKVAFVVIFFLENIFIRCAVAFEKGFLFDGYDNQKNGGINYDTRQADSATEGSCDDRKDQTRADWFVGISSAEELKQRYRELMKIYHPDNRAGDTNAVQQIQAEYEELIKRY